MKLAHLISFSILMTLAVAAVTARAETHGDILKQISAAPALKAFAKGIEKQYDVECSAYSLERFEDSDFTAKAVCADKDAKDEEASAVILTITGSTMEGSPVILSNIQIDYAN